MNTSSLPMCVGRQCRTIFLVAVASYAASPAVAQSNYALDDLKHEVRLSSVEISPDGAQLVVVASRPDYEQNRYLNQLFLVEVDSGHTRPLTFDRPNIQQPRWSPNGGRIGFIASKDGNRQVFVLDLRGGEAQAVTDFEQGIVSFCWGPKGRRLAFTGAGPAIETKGQQKHNKSFEVTRDSYLAAAPSPPIHLWIRDLEQGDTRQLTSGTESVVSPFGVPFDFSPGGNSLVYVARPSPAEGFFVDLTLKSIELASGKTRTLVSNPGILGLPRFSPDGKLVSYMAPRGREPLFSPFSVFTVAVSTGEVVDAAARLDRSITGGWLPQSRTLLLTGANNTQNAAWLQDLNGTPKLLDLGDVHVAGQLSASDSGVLAFAGSRPGQLSEVYRLDSVDGQPRRLTEFNAKLSSKQAGKVESIRWDCPNGFKADGVLVFPPGYQQGRKYPLVLNIHGGPMYRSTEAFSLWKQIMAAKGWIVFSPNYRGSDNRGRRFQQAIVNDAGEGPGQDVMAGVAALKQRGIVDEGRMAVSGWSYGGFMTVWLTAHYHNWKAAVAGAPVTDWFDQYNLSDLNNWFGVGLGGSPWKNGNSRNYSRQSPITYAHQIRTPTLILSNARDPRVAVTQSYKLFYALRDNNVPVSFIAYPTEVHFPADPIHERDVLERWIAWIEQHLEE